jgi:transposase
MDGKDVIIALQQEHIEHLVQRVGELEAEVDRLKRNSSNSSKPPSSDIVKPPPPKTSRKTKRRRGGQAGHKRHVRPAFPPEKVDRVVEYQLDDRPDLEPLDDWQVVQQIELVECPFVVTEHRARRYRSGRTGRIITAPLPLEVQRGGLLGLRLSALVAHLKGVCHASYSTVQAFLRDVVGVKVSRGQLAKTVRKVADALGAAHDELAGLVADERHVGADETGHKNAGQAHWTWCFRGRRFTLFKIDRSRSSAVLLKVLGETFGGVLSCDFFGAYRKYVATSHTRVQYCLAHLIREVRFLAENRSATLKVWAEGLLKALKSLFHTLHRAETMTAAGFARATSRSRRRFLYLVGQPPDHADARRLSRRLCKHGEEYFTFLHESGTPPTNNLTEQAIRFVVLDRKVTQGTRSDWGQRWCERIWTVRATCAHHGRSTFRFLVDSLQAHWSNHPTPSLLFAKA